MYGKNYKINPEQIIELIPGMGYCLATDKIMVDGEQIGYMYREQPEDDSDSGWRFFSGTEEESYTDDSDNFGMYDLNTVANYDKDIIPFLKTAFDCEFERDEEGGKFRKVVD